MRGRFGHAIAWGYLAVAIIFITVIPAVTVLRGTVAGIHLVLGNFVLGRELAAGVVVGGLAAAAAWFLAGRVRRFWTWPVLVCLPGLLGPLVLGLTVLATLQWPVLRVLRDTPWPLIVTLALLLAPLALLLRLTLQRGPTSSVHTARMLHPRQARPLVWRLETRARVFTMFLLFAWGFFDLTASSLLAPVGMTPITARLYNLMHYGQTAVLSAMVCLAFATPLLVLLLVFAGRGLIAGLLRHD
jgi:hypothetical protein